MAVKSEGKWYRTLLGGLLGLLMGLIPSALSVLLFGRLYYFCYIFIPIIICLFIRLFRGNRGRLSLLFAGILSLIGIYFTGFFIMAANLVSAYELPNHEVFRLTFLMMKEFSAYGSEALKTLAGDVFKVIFILAYLAVGLLFSREFILKCEKPAGKASGLSGRSKKEVGESEDGEYEYVYEDELLPDDEVIDRR
ncbi:MAG: hypothetical protein IJL71_07350 [Oscillospiraceae bacterium]|nr:hypothetical protein [Oscillospiraceae bacterium]